MPSFASASRAFILALTLLSAHEAIALDLDWHGQFRAEENLIFGYTHSVNPAVNNGYTVPLNGDSAATFQNLFFRLTPRVLVNDNVSLHTDLWLGTPDGGFFGGNGTAGNYHSSSTGNASVTAHTLYSEVATDFGTIRVGRVPLNWGLGLVWNAKDQGFDRLPSSGDGISLTTKLGAFRFSPTIVKYQRVGTVTALGNSGVSDYTASLTYANDDEQLDLGVMFMRRIAGINSNVLNPYSITSNATLTTTTYGYAYNMWDFYAHKKTGIVTLAAEVPLVSGTVGGHTYSTVAGALNVEAQTSEKWKLKVNAGLAQGQDNGTAGAPADKFTAFSFHPDYRPGFLLFNYNYRNISNGVGSAYDNPVTNARFIALGADYNTGKWTHGFQWVYAQADKAADGVAGNVYYNAADGHYAVENGSAAQDKGLGWELDYLIGYDWDESIRFGFDMGLYVPGKFYDFNNGSPANGKRTIFGTLLNMLVKF